MKRILIFCPLLFVFHACVNQEVKRDGHTAKEKTREDSIMVIEKPFSDNPAKIEYRIPVLKGTNLRHGIQKRYYPHGSLYSEIPYIRNERNGVAYTYYKAYKGEKPAVWKEQRYVNGKLNGICKRYYQDGKIQAEYEYKDGMPAVGLKEYSESGKLLKQPGLSVQSSSTERYYYVTACLSKPVHEETYYIGELEEGRFMPPNLKKIQERNGVGEVLIPKDVSKVTVVATFYTSLSNECILSKTISLK
ncbi:MAG: hypothetical protein RBS73_11725 [Prolixibacteraceae bacterium]|jgi:hypothetical protein|nr:hypothetical protein [Prolixibacteraceae bacterium]